MAKKKAPKVTVQNLETDVVPDGRNANLGTKRGQEMIARSVERNGAGRSLLIDKDGNAIAGNKSRQQMIDQGITEVIVVETDGTQAVAVKRTDLELDGEDGRARELAYFDNRTSEIDLNWDTERLMEDMDNLDIGELWSENELASLMGDVMLPPEATTKVSPRDLPIDVIITISSGSVGGSAAALFCCIAARAGLKYGWQAFQDGTERGPCPMACAMKNHETIFLDNDFYHYDHELHKSIVAKHQPKYATVMDVMSKAQCKEAGIEYAEFEQILDWAEELNEHAENVIVIPKIDVLDKIPEKFVLGYSVPTSHGGTPLPVTSFAGRNVHLLGGSWKAQLKHMNVLGDDVVSLDNNYILKQANYASFVTKDAKDMSLTDIGIGADEVSNPAYIAFSLSVGAIGMAVHELYNKPPETADA